MVLYEVDLAFGRVGGGEDSGENVEEIVSLSLFQP